MCVCVCVMMCMNVNTVRVWSYILCILSNKMCASMCVCVTANGFYEC